LAFARYFGCLAIAFRIMTPSETGGARWAGMPNEP
jgi:hypothetical protein